MTVPDKEFTLGFARHRSPIEAEQGGQSIGVVTRVARHLGVQLPETIHLSQHRSPQLDRGLLIRKPQP